MPSQPFSSAGLPGPRKFNAPQIWRYDQKMGGGGLLSPGGRYSISVVETVGPATDVVAGANTALTLWPTRNPSGALVTAADLSNVFATQVAIASKFGTTATPAWVELWGLGNVSILTSGSQFPPSGNGLLWPPDLTRARFAAGTWTLNVRIGINTAGASAVADVHVRAYRYNAGVYTLIAEGVSAGASFSQASPAIVACTAAGIAETSFAAGDMLYFDIQLLVTSTTNFVASTTFQLQQTAVSSQTALVTPGYTIDRRLVLARGPVESLSAATATPTRVVAFKRSIIESVGPVPAQEAPALFYGAGYSQCHDVAKVSVHGSSFMLMGGDVYGVWRSVDRGRTWQPSASGLTTTGYRNVTAIKISEHHSGYAYAMVGSGNFHWAWSSDKGVTWTPMTGTVMPQTWGATDQPRATGRLLAVAPGADAQHDSLYFGTSNGIFRSVGNGSFQQAGATPIALGSGDTGTSSLAVVAGTSTHMTMSSMPAYWRTGMSVAISHAGDTTETLQVNVDQAAGTIWPLVGNWGFSHQTGSTATGQGFRLFDLILDPNDATIAYASFCPQGLAAGGAVFRVAGIQSGGTIVVTVIDAPSQPMGLWAVVEGGATVLYVACAAGIRRITTPAGTPSVTTITTGLSDSGGTGVAFDNVNTNWNGITGYSDGTHTRLYVGAGTPVTVISGALLQTAWRIDQAEGSPVIYLICATTGNRKNTYFDATGDIWWFGLGSASTLFGGGSYVITELNIDPDNLDRIYFSGRAGMWTCGNPLVTQPDVYPDVYGISATVAQDSRIDPANPLIQVVGDTDWCLFITTDEWQTSANLTNRSAFAPGGANNRCAYATRFDTFGAPNPSPLLIGGGNRDTNASGWLSSLATPIATGAETHENGVGSGWPGGTWGVAGALRCMAVAQGTDQTAARVLLAVADSENGASGYGIVRKVGAPGAGTWSMALAGFSTSSNKAPSLYFADATHIYAYDAVAGVIYRASELEQVNNYGQTWAAIIGGGASVSFPADATDAVNQSFLCVDPTLPSRLYFGTTTNVYRVDNADSTPVVTQITGPINKPGVLACDKNGTLYVVQLPVGFTAAFWQCPNPTAVSPTWTDISNATFRASQINPNNMVIGTDGSVIMSNGGLGGWTAHVGLSDVVTRVAGFGRGITETLTAATASVSRLLALIRGPVETVGPATATPSRILALIRGITETVGPAVDTVSAVRGFLRAVAETVGPALDAVSRLLGRSRTVTETVGPAADTTVTRALTLSRLLAETVPFSEVVSRQLGRSRFLIETVGPAIDSLGIVVFHIPRLREKVTSVASRSTITSGMGTRSVTSREAGETVTTEVEASL